MKMMRHTRLTAALLLSGIISFTTSCNEDEDDFEVIATISVDSSFANLKATATTDYSQGYPITTLSLIHI